MKRTLAVNYRFEWKPQDMWIGVYWKRTPGEDVDRLDVWVCLLPMLPFHYVRYYR